MAENGLQAENEAFDLEGRPFESPRGQEAATPELDTQNFAKNEENGEK